MFFMKKLNSMTLDTLRAVIPVLSEKEQSACIGGGSGSELTPFSMEEFTGLFHDGIWKGGYVQLENDGLSSSICYVSSTVSNLTVPYNVCRMLLMAVIIT